MNRRVLLMVAAMFCAVSAKACYTTASTSRTLRSYRIYDPSLYQKSKAATRQRENCLAWQRMTNGSVPTDHIKSVVYDWSLEQLNDALSQKSQANRFVAWLKGNPQQMEFMKLAKRTEKVRYASNDPWYYASPGDSISTELAKIADEAKSHLDGPMGDRYLLQLVRALKGMGRDKEIIDIYGSRGAKDPLMREMTTDYVASAHYALGQYDKALAYYGPKNDVESVMLVLKAKGDECDFYDIVRTFVASQGGAEQIAERLQESVWMDEDCEDTADFKELALLAKELSVKAKPSDRAIWKYTEALCQMHTGEIEAAHRAIVEAASLPATPFMQKSIRVLNYFIEAQRLPIDDAYEQMLYEASRWFAKQDKNERLPVGSETSDDGDYEWLVSLRNMNRTNFYFPDMYRKLAESYAAPRLIKSGRTTLALQIMDMGDNIFLPKTVINKQNNHLGALFAMADTLGADAVGTFAKRLLNPKSERDRFYGDHGSRCNPDYWYDLTGTLLLRECRYEEAEKWLKKVSNQYNARQTARPYYRRNPFAFDYLGGECYRKGDTQMKIRNDYKLWFARRMVQLKRAYTRGGNADSRAKAKYEYALGMRNSAYPCWALTGYYCAELLMDSHIDIGDTYEFDVYGGGKYISRHEKDLDRIRRTSDAMMKEAKANIADREYLARIEWAQGNYKTVKRHYDNTALAQAKKSRCDRWKDY